MKAPLRLAPLREHVLTAKTTENKQMSQRKLRQLPTVNRPLTLRLCACPSVQAGLGANIFSLHEQLLQILLLKFYIRRIS